MSWGGQKIISATIKKGLNTRWLDNLMEIKQYID